jgi:hypothetical protein
LIGGRTGRVTVEDGETVENDDEGLKGFSVGLFSSCTDVPKDRPGEKAGALGLRALARGFCCTGPEGVGLAPKLEPDGTLWEAEKAKDEDSTMPGAGAGNVDRVGGPKVEVGSDTAGADADGPKGEKVEAGLVGSPSKEVLEAPKAEEEAPPNTEEELPKAELEPKIRFPNTFGVVLRFANAEAAGGMTEVAGIKAEVAGGCSTIGSSSCRKASSSSYSSCSASTYPSSESTPSTMSGIARPSRMASISSIVSFPKWRSRMQATR